MTIWNTDPLYYIQKEFAIAISPIAFQAMGIDRKMWPKHWSAFVKTHYDITSILKVG